MSNIFSIGYAGLSQDKFIEILKSHNISAIADVRSSPFSKMFSGYNKDNMPQWLAENGIKYVYLGQELGPRSANSNHYVNDQVQFDRLSQTDGFKQGISRLNKGAQAMNIAIMCAEKDPMTCHRSLLVAEFSKDSGLEFKHIHQDGRLESHEDMLLRAMKVYKIMPDMLTDEADCKKSAHAKLCLQYAYKKPNKNNNMEGARP
jgi:uncharacterized protein (DUF488 family)